MEELRRQREEQERRERAEQERLAKLKAEQERQRKLAEQRRAEQQRLAAQQNKAAQQQQPTEEVASSKPERGSGISSAGYYSGLKTNGSLRWPVQGPILIAYGSPRTAELKWKGT